MSLCKLPLELRYRVYTYLVYDTLESPAPRPLVQIIKPKSSGHLSHRHCRFHASPKEVYEHFVHKMTDPVQAYGSMFMEYGSNRPCLSTPRPKTYGERILDISAECGCKKGLPPFGHAGIPKIFPLLLTCRQIVYEIRAWLYPHIIFDFPLNEAEAFGRFTASLLPETRKFVREIRLTMPIHDYRFLCKQTHLTWVYIQHSFDWMRATPKNLEDLLPNLRALHVNMWHGSRRLYIEGGFSGLPAPIKDEKWRKKALEPVLRFASLPLKEVTVVVDNVWPLGEIWSGDPRAHERRELAEYLRKQLLDA
ncbi:hypothetical protein PMIN01_07358 [Paraphaeosphaeria minitans]|uniref:Uncharacterized protein n=1 Tax=Paraphaeosphaeria minitans TaxID=565426 RepID=A0A9P6KPW0_9PLEO|nr:hypothetical protein PMIN01_07358 [Paraphaeosphaeria minitans]